MGYGGVELLTHGMHRGDADGEMRLNYYLRPEWPGEHIAAARDLLGRLGLRCVCVSPSDNFLAPQSGSVQGEIDEVERRVDLAVRLPACASW